MSDYYILDDNEPVPENFEDENEYFIAKKEYKKKVSEQHEIMEKIKEDLKNGKIS